MEVDLRKIISRHLKDIVGVREKYVATLLIRGHKLMFPFLKGGQSLIVVALNPASLIEAYWLPSALSPVFMKQAILNHLKLKLADSADNFPSVEIICEYLGHAFIHKLVNPFVKLLLLHRVSILYILEHLRRERGDP